jgi:mRNA interferase MazF
MEKDFDTWNNKKKLVHKDENPRLFQEREIWWCSLGLNVGFEEDGKHDQFERPVLILKKFNKHVAWAIPMTTQAHEDIFHHQLKNGESFLILSQLRLISSKRLLAKIEKITEDEHKEIFEILKRFLTTKKISSKEN